MCCKSLVDSLGRLPVWASSARQIFRTLGTDGIAQTILGYTHSGYSLESCINATAPFLFRCNRTMALMIRERIHKLPPLRSWKRQPIVSGQPYHDSLRELKPSNSVYLSMKTIRLTNYCTSSTMTPKRQSSNFNASVTSTLQEQKAPSQMETYVHLLLGHWKFCPYPAFLVEVSSTSDARINTTAYNVDTSAWSIVTQLNGAALSSRGSYNQSSINCNYSSATTSRFPNVNRNASWLGGSSNNWQLQGIKTTIDTLIIHKCPLSRNQNTIS